MEQDVRWLQRFDNLEKACNRILEITEGDRQCMELSELEREGLIQRFEYSYELAWKTMQDFLRYLGYDYQAGPNATIRLALEVGIIERAEEWRDMAAARITTSHTYNEDDATEVAERIYDTYSFLLKDLVRYLQHQREFYNKEQ
ncbi:MAG: nucleotidyltransferase substrate binding protein [Bacteroidaceae bacterium]|nr:nucleotidyltransferase substrate binding protein [Bacteroidaceae bacterium]